MRRGLSRQPSRHVHSITDSILLQQTAIPCVKHLPVPRVGPGIQTPTAARTATLRTERPLLAHADGGNRASLLPPFMTPSKTIGEGGLKGDQWARGQECAFSGALSGELQLEMTSPTNRPRIVPAEGNSGFCSGEVAGTSDDGGNRCEPGRCASSPRPQRATEDTHSH